MTCWRYSGNSAMILFLFLLACLGIGRTESASCEHLLNASSYSRMSSCSMDLHDLRCDYEPLLSFSFRVDSVLHKDNESTTYCLGLNYIDSAFFYNTTNYINRSLLYFDEQRPIAVTTLSNDSKLKNNPKIIFDSSFPALPPQTSRPDVKAYLNFSASLWLVDELRVKGLDLKGTCEIIHNIKYAGNSSLTFLNIFMHDIGHSTQIQCRDLLLPHMPALKRLSVYSTLMDSFAEENFQNAPRLEELKLKNIVKFPKGLSTAQNLHVLDLSGNQAMEYERSIFKTLSNLENLEYLDISRSPSFSISSDILSFKKLREMNISGCELPFLYGMAFVNLKTLDTIDLSGNKLEYINMTVPENLRTLILKNNLLHSVSFSLRRDHELKLLDISYNRLNVFPQFYQVVTIKALNITGNNITGFTTPNIIVHSLDMSLNNVHNWTHHLQFSFVINKLNISRNVIFHLTERMKSSIDHLNEVNLEGNPFDCNDCQINNLQSLVSQTKPHVPTELTCFTPADKKGLPIVDAECLDIRPNFPLIVGLPLGLLTLVAIAILVIIYRYRFEFTYIKHLHKIRTGREKDSSDALYDAFVCYSGHDRPWVLGELAPMLETGEEKYRLCLHDRDFLLGSHIQRNIVHSIDRSRRTIIVLSQKFIASRWCQKELDMANHKIFEDSRQFLILLEIERLDRTIIPRHLKFLMDTRTYLEWPKDSDAREDGKKIAIKRLKEALGTSIFQKKSEIPQQDNELLEMR